MSDLNTQLAQVIQISIGKIINFIYDLKTESTHKPKNGVILFFVDLNPRYVQLHFLFVFLYISLFLMKSLDHIHKLFIIIEGAW